MPAPDTTLLLEKMATHNDEQALKRLFDLYYSRLLSFAVSFLHNRPVAEEVVEDVFIKLWEKRASLPPVTNLFAYLLTATRNGMLNYQRLTKNQAYLHVETVQVELTAGLGNPEERLISAQALQQVNAAIATLPPQCRLIFLLVKEYGLKHREAAGLLHLSVKTVETQIGLALHKMSEALLEAGISTTAKSRRKK